MRVRDTAVADSSRRGLLAADAVAGRPTPGDTGGPLLAGEPGAFVQVGVTQGTSGEGPEHFSLVGPADDLLSLPVLTSPATRPPAPPEGRFAGESDIATAHSSFLENRLLRPDPAMPPRPPRVRLESAQIVTPATARPGTQVRVQWTQVAFTPAVDYTASGPVCRTSLDQPFTGVPFHWSAFFEKPPRVHVYPARSPAAKPPFSATRHAVSSRRVARARYPARLEPCTSVSTASETRQFRAPKRPGRYAVSWGLPRVRRLVAHGESVPLHRVGYRIAGSLPTLTVTERR
jgi:hypothetical protein